MAPRYALLVSALVALSVPHMLVAQPSDSLSLADLEQRVAALFDRSCARSGCHAGPVPQMGMNLGPDHFREATVGVASQEQPGLLRVHPGRPDSSYLVMKVEGRSGLIGAQMPLTGDRLTREEIDTIRAWITRLGEGSAPTGSAGASRVSGETYPFVGWKVVNLPTTRTVDRGSLLFLIGHRFNPRLTDGYDAFFGLDGSGIIFLNLGYAVTDRLFVNVGRSNADDDVEVDLRYRLARQGRWPVAASLQTAVNWQSEKPPGRSRLRSEAFSYSAQFTLARTLGRVLGVAVVPGVLLNPAPEASGDGPLVTVGIAGRLHVAGNMALVSEWVPIVAGYVQTTTFGNANRFDSWAGGLEIATGGHVFQIVLSNSVGLTTSQYLRGGDLDVSSGDVRLGFNIFRILNF